MTLAETLVATALAGLVALAMMMVTGFTARSFAAIANYVELDVDSRQAIDRMSQKVRQTRQVTAFTTNSITLRYANNTPLQYTYAAQAKTLTENDNGVTKVLLRDCDALHFELFKRNPVTNSFNQFPVLTALGEAKVIRVSWRCSRTPSQGRGTTEELRSARIVMRSK